MTSASLRTLDGHRVKISGEDIDLSLPWSASVSFARDSTMFGFQAGPRGMWQDIMVHHPDFSFSESYLYQGGELKLGSAIVDDDYGYDMSGERAADKVWLAAWEGENFSVAAMIRERRETKPDLMSWFDDFDILETPEGIVLKPRAGSGVEPFDADIVKEVPQVGVLTVRDAREGSSLVPAWEGTRVAGGELFVGHDRSHFLLVNEGSLTVIEPSSEESFGSPEAMRRLESLTVRWD